MFKRSSANYSLWPEQARPRRGLPLSLAAGGFAVGIICAIAVVNGTSQFIRPVAMEVEPVEPAAPVRPIPVYSASSASALVESKAAAAADEPETRSLKRPVAKVALPTIGRAVPVTSETDGRGGDTAVKMPPVRLTDDSGNPSAIANANPKLIRNGTQEAPATADDETKVAAHEPAPQAAAEPKREEAKPAPVKKRSTYRRTRSRRAEPRRSRPRRPTYAAPYRAGPVYGYNGAPIRGYYYQPY